MTQYKTAAFCSDLHAEFFPPQWWLEMAEAYAFKTGKIWPFRAFFEQAAAEAENEENRRFAADAGVYPVFPDDAQWVFLAGDMASAHIGWNRQAQGQKSLFEYLLHLLSGIYPEKHFFVVFGNHEFHRCVHDKGRLFVRYDILSATGGETVYYEPARNLDLPNVTVLNGWNKNPNKQDSSLFIDETAKIAVYGTVLWAGFSCYPDDTEEQIAANMQSCASLLEHARIGTKTGKPFDTVTCRKVHQNEQKRLQMFLTNPDYKSYTKVVLSHFAPSAGCMPPQHQKQDDLTPDINGYFYNCCDDLLQYADFWIYGHTHSNIEFTLPGGCRVLSNQFGYQSAEQRENVTGMPFDWRRTISIPFGKI